MRAQVRKRDGNACVVCGATEKLSVHHVVKQGEGRDDRLENLVTLCVTHHRQADAARSLLIQGGDLQVDPPAAEAPAQELRAYEDDPEHGIFWGPPDGLTGEPLRWSRAWFDWRNE